nr:Protein C17H12.13, isoform a [Haemonchus contortus]
MESVTSEEEVIEFLREHFTTKEPILSNLHISKIDELTVLLTDVVRDCMSCPASRVIRDSQSNELLGVCLSSRASLFEKQMDRLFCYEFTDPQLRIAIDFLKSVFNRADVAYHLEENHVTKPVFVAIVSVHPDHWNKGIASALLENCLLAAREDRCDGALALCSSSRASRLMLKKFKNVVCRTRYCDYRGEYRNPPISPPEPDSAIHVLLTKL